jgi:hypothetical protein
VDAGDELVLRFHDRVGGLGQCRLKEAQQHGVALRWLEASQAPGIVAVAPAGQKPTGRWMNVGQRWPFDEAEGVNEFQAIE